MRERQEKETWPWHNAKRWKELSGVFDPIRECLRDGINVFSDLPADDCTEIFFGACRLAAAILHHLGASNPDLDAPEIAQKLCEKLETGFPKYDTLMPFAPYGARAILFLCLTHMRSSRSRPMSLDGENSPLIDDLVDRDSQRISEWVCSEMGSLDDEERTMLELQYWGNMTVREIAAQLGLTKSRIEQGTFKARNLLGERLLNDFGNRATKRYKKKRAA